MQQLVLVIIYQTAGLNYFTVVSNGIINATVQNIEKMFALLDQQDYFIVYGTAEHWTYASKSRCELLPFDGKSVVAAIQRAGVTLILHTDMHIKNSTPTSRIFEAAAGSSVIISDKHPFILKHFADAVLYIDDNATGEQLFTQIDSHMKWILAHPVEAKELARRAHEIFIKQFTLEQQLQNLVKLHAKMLNGEK